MGKAFDAFLGEQWAIQEDSANQIQEIIQHHKSLSSFEVEAKIDALATKLGRQLDNARSATIRDGIAIIPMNGPVFPKANLFTEISGAHSLEAIAADFDAAEENPSVKTILMHFETAPGGVASGIHEFSRIIRNSHKPVVAYVGSMAASAHMWLASAASRIVIDATAIVGNIGVVTKRRKKKDSDDIEIVSSRAQDKRPNAETEEGMGVIRAELDAIEDVFINTVAEYLGQSAEEIASHRGRVLIGADAVAAGFAHELGSFESVIAGLSGGTQEGITMADQKPDAPEITRAYLAANHPDIVAAIESDAATTARTEGVAAGATAERERIQSVLDQSMPGHEALIQGLAFDGKTTGPEGAVAVLQAEKAGRARHRANMEEDTPQPVPGASELDDDKKGEGEGETFEGKIKAYQADGMTRGKAMATAARNHPAMHKEWLARINKAS